MNEKVNKAYRMLDIILNFFIYLDKHSFVSLYRPKTMVRPHLEYANSVGFPYKKILKLLRKSKKSYYS